MNGLTDEEIKLIELFRMCENVHFYKYDCTFDEAEKFASLNTEPDISESKGESWIFSEKEKIRVTAFLK